MATHKPKIGSILGQRYRIERLLGKGTRGSIYLSSDLWEELVPVAVKILPATKFNGGSVPDLQQQLSQLSRIRHPNLVSLLDFGMCENGGFHYIVQEYINGRDLLSATANYTTDEVLHLLVKICRGLQHLHSRGILHLALKPANVILADGESAKADPRITNFGFSDSWARTGRTRRIETLAYAPPEIILGHTPTVRADLYSLGILAYHLLVRRLPFEGDDQGYLIQKHLQGRPDLRPVERLPGGPGLVQALGSLLEKDAVRRPSSAEDVVHLLSVASGHDFVGAATEPSEIYFQSGRFVGREREMSLLTAQADRVKQNDRGWTTFVLGESGVGKSRLMDEFRMWGLLEGWRVIEASCLPLEAKSYGPYRRMLTDTLALVAQEQDGATGEVVLRFEDLPRAPQEEQLKLTAESAAGQFRDLLTREIVKRLSGRPTLLFLHDFHWADDATAAVLDFLISDIREHCVMICVSARPGGVKDNALARVLEQSKKHQRATSMDLESLAQIEVRQLIASILGEPGLAARVSRWTYETSGGNPLFVEEILKHLADRGLLHRATGNWDLDEKHLKGLEVPSNIAAVIRQRLAHLTPSAQLVIHWLAAINRAVPLDFLGAVIQKPSEKLADVLVELSARQIVRSLDETGEVKYELRHALISEVVRLDLSRASLKKMHRRIGEELEQHYMAETHRQEIALHYTEAKFGTKAIQYALEAASESKSEFAYEAAMRFYTYILQNRNNLSKEQLCEVAIDAADTACILGNPKQAIRMLNVSRGRGMANRPNSMTTRYHLQRSRAYQLLGNLRISEQEARHGLNLVKSKDASGDQANIETALLCQLAFCMMAKSDTRKGLETLKRGLRVICDPMSELERGHLYVLMAGLLWVACEFKEGQRASQLAVNILEPLGAYHLLPMAYSHLGINLAAMGKLGSAAHAHENALKLGGRARSPFLKVQSMCNLAESYCRSGQFSDARRISYEMIKIAADLDNEYILFACKICLVEIQIAMNEYNSAYQALSELNENMHSKLPVFSRAQAIFWKAFLEVELGDRKKARQDLQRLKRLSSTGIPVYESAIEGILRARMYRQEGRFEEAITLLRELESKYKKNHWAYLTATVKIELAEMLLKQNKWDQARRLARDAVRLSRAMPSLRLEACSLLALGKVYLHALKDVDLDSSQNRQAISSEYYEKAHSMITDAIRISDRQKISDVSWRAHVELCKAWELTQNYKMACEHAHIAMQKFEIVKSSVPIELAQSFCEIWDHKDTMGYLNNLMKRTDAWNQPTTLEFGEMESNHLRLLFRISGQINSIREIETLTVVLADRLIEALAMDRVLIFLKENSTSKLHLAKGRSSAGATLTDSDSIAIAIIEEVQLNGTPFVTADACRDSRISKEQSEFQDARGTIFCAPLKVCDRELGILYADEQSPRGSISESAINLFASFCNLAAMAIDNALAHQQLYQEKAELKQFLRHAQEGYGEIIGQAEIMKKLRAHIAKVARSPMDVLIMGETGTGKELVARALHRTGLRSSGPFVALDCGSISDTIAEAEFFGYRKGAFTGALENRVGLLESANGGVIFLDEISNLSLKLQQKLLRVLEEREIRRVGETSVRKIDIQVIAATNRDLKKDIKKGSFRDDLFFRLYAMEVYVPPLRERIRDIPILVEHFIENAAQQSRSRKKGVAREAWSLFKKYPYPGNVRELQQIVNRTYHLTHSQIIRPENLPMELHEDKETVRYAKWNSESDSQQIYADIIEGKGDFETLVKKPFFDRLISKPVVRDVIRRSLIDADGKYRDAFRLLGVPEKDYRLQLQFLKRHDCFLDFRPFRKTP